MKVQTIGYTFTIVCRNNRTPYVFCKYYLCLDEAIAYARAELAARSKYDVEYILIREGVNSPADPIVWDSRKVVAAPVSEPSALAKHAISLVEQAFVFNQLTPQPTSPSRALARMCMMLYPYGSSTITILSSIHDFGWKEVTTEDVEAVIKTLKAMG